VKKRVLKGNLGRLDVLPPLRRKLLRKRGEQIEVQCMGLSKEKAVLLKKEKILDVRLSDRTLQKVFIQILLNAIRLLKGYGRENLYL